MGVSLIITSLACVSSPLQKGMAPTGLFVLEPGDSAFIKQFITLGENENPGSYDSRNEQHGQPVPAQPVKKNPAICEHLLDFAYSMTRDCQGKSSGDYIFINRSSRSQDKSINVWFNKEITGADSEI